ncbi:hypothetical protein H0O00_03230 [Candidatus Micrarchaeota archaeon]|nr:hypothetical protein [Candidatus Micrarchaeota archaeon]
MAEPKQVKRNDVRVPALAMAKGFGRYGPMKEEATRPFEVVEDETLRQMKVAWGAFKVRKRIHVYTDALRLVKPLKYSASDVERFSFVLAEFQHEKWFREKAGFFLSALINKGKDSDYIIHTAHLGVEIDGIGHENTKNITVEGDAGFGVGDWMKRGTIIVNGNAGQDAASSMDGGSIRVKGNVDKDAGRSMRGGSLIVEGDASEGVGNAMAGGTIIVEGNAGEGAGSEMWGGNVIVNGDAGDNVGAYMRGGTITVKGRAGAGVGSEMYSSALTLKGDLGDLISHPVAVTGGEIHLQGDYVSISDIIRQGKIFHKEKLIVDK